MNEQASLSQMARPSFRRGGGKGRVAVIDVGSNSIRLVVFETASRAPAYFFNEKAVCGLGAQLARTGRLCPDGVARARLALARFAALAERMKVSSVDAVATAAARDAADGAAFCAQVEADTGLRLRVISGDEEARLSALGVLLGEPGADGVVADMGGSSVELAEVRGGAVGRRLTLALGPQRLAGLSGAELTARIDDECARAARTIETGAGALYVVGGAWRTVAKAQIARCGHPLQVLHGFRLSAPDACRALREIAAMDVEAIRALPGVSATRAPTTPLAARLLGEIVRRLGPRAMAMSAFGLREGLLYERLSPRLRAADPLLEACATLERQQARFPGFGLELADWLAPLCADWPAEARRLAMAACLLNDVNWRAHPDYRAVSCFETVTRANLGGIDHAGRVFVGHALMQRYGGGRPTADIDAARALLDDAALTRARALGRAMRLGAMLSGSTPQTLRHAQLAIGDGRVSLTLGASLRALSGETVQRRLKSLADALNAEPAYIEAD